jgi:spore maturation protein A
MLRYFWVVILAISVLLAGVHHQWAPLLHTFYLLPLKLVHLLLWMAGFLLLWNALLGCMRALGWLEWQARLLRPLLRRLFPRSVDDETLNWIALNVAANMLGMGNAATPAGLSAMQGLQQVNADKKRASDAMCLLLAINTSSVQLIPASAIAILAAAGFPHPLLIVIPTWVVTSLTTVAAIVGAKALAWRRQAPLDEVVDV